MDGVFPIKFEYSDAPALISTSALDGILNHFSHIKVHIHSDCII